MKLWKHAPFTEPRPVPYDSSLDAALMWRWHVIPRNRFFNVYLHKILRDDDSRALHDHPWASLAISTGYQEVVFAKRLTRLHRVLEISYLWPSLTLRRRHFGQPIFRRAMTAHRLVLNRDSNNQPIPAWSLFITGPHRRNWGFWIRKGDGLEMYWMPHQDYR